MTPLSFDFFSLLWQGQAVDLYHVVQHTGEHGNSFAERVPVKVSFVGKWFIDKTAKIN